jgi:NRPS condensation-like uncharacterized protein
MSRGITAGLNNTDFLFLAMEDVVPSQGMLLMLRFATQHTEEEMRTAFRYIFTIFPRLRSIVEPTLFSYRLRILDEDDERMEVLFNDAFRVKHDLKVDTDAFVKYRRDLYNEAFSLEQGLPVKIRFIVDDPKPALLISMHHMIADGLSIYIMANALMAYLNGKKTPVDNEVNPSIWPVMLEKSRMKIPGQVYRSAKNLIHNLRQPKPGPFVQASARPANYFGPVDMHMHYMRYSVSDLKSMAKAYGVSITVLVITALVMSLSKGNKQGESIGIIMPVDLRSYFEGGRPGFGNYAFAPMIIINRKIWEKPEKIVEEVKTQMSSIVTNIKNKDLVAGFLVESLSRFIGKKQFARVIRMIKHNGLLAKTATFANLGTLDYLNSHGDKAQICFANGSTTSHGLFIDMTTLGDKVTLAVTYQESEFTNDEIKAFLELFEDMLGAIGK